MHRCAAQWLYAALCTVACHIPHGTANPDTGAAPAPITAQPHQARPQDAAAANRLAYPVKVNITGIKGHLLENTQAFLSVYHSHRQQHALSAAELQRQLAIAAKETRTALQAYGYYTPQLSHQHIQQGQSWVVTVHIDPGPVTTLRRVDIRIADPPQQVPTLYAHLQPQALQQHGIKPGAALNHSAYEQLKQRLSDEALALGYLAHRFDPARITVDPAQQHADIDLHLHLGERYYFGAIQLIQHHLADAFVNKMLTLKTGAPYQSAALLQQQLALSHSAYFDTVHIDSQPPAEETPTHIPLVIHTTASKPQQYTVGVGFGTDTGPRLRLDTQFRYLNRHGHQSQHGLLLSDPKRQLSSRYLLPFQQVLHDRWSLDLQLTSERIGDATEPSEQIIVGLSRNDQWQQGQRHAFLRYQNEQFTLGEQDDHTDYLIPGFEWSAQRVDDPIFPRHGLRGSVHLSGATRQLLATTDFLRVHGTWQGIRALDAQSRALLRLEVGAIHSRDFQRLPPSLRFYAGGDQSVRGYGYQSLGPRAGNGDTLGGAYLVTVSLELDRLIYRHWGIAAFMDAGSVSEHATLDPNIGVGIGLRWRAPVGMLRIDLAHPRDLDTRTWRLHLSLGPE